MISLSSFPLDLNLYFVPLISSSIVNLSNPLQHLIYFLSFPILSSVIYFMIQYFVFLALD